jgi:hypothetical protein
VVIGVLGYPLFISQAGTRLFALGFTAIALFVRVLRRRHETLSTVMALPFSATYHCPETITSHPVNKMKKSQEEEIFLEV